MLLEELRAAALEPHEFLEVSLDGGTLTVRGMMAKDPLLETRMELATLFRSASGFGGKGELVVFGYLTSAFGYRVKVERAKSSVKAMSKKEQDGFERSKAYREIDARVQASLDRLVGAPPRQTVRGKKGQGKGKWGVNPFTGKRIWVPTRSALVVKGEPHRHHMPQVVEPVVGQPREVEAVARVDLEVAAERVQQLERDGGRVLVVFEHDQVG